MALFEVKDADRRFYEERLRGFLPSKLIDIHTHVGKKELYQRPEDAKEKTVSWPSRVAEENPIEDLFETYRLMFPDKKVTPLMFPTLSIKMDELNRYVSGCSHTRGVPALIFSLPRWDRREFEKRIIEGGFIGAKSYLTAADSSIPADEITIFDFFPHHQLEVMDAHTWIMMLHIPRDKRLRDTKNIEQLLEIDRKYPNLQCVVAHVGRAYCNEDVGDAFDALENTEHLMFDISANTNEWVFEQAIKTVGPKRILFGSDMPILRMRMKRICENGVYINIVPEGLYGDVSDDIHMREAEGEEAEHLTFFMYEEIDAFRRAAENTGLTADDIEDVFYRNAAGMFAKAGYGGSI